MIRVEHLTKHYGSRVAVADVSFEVQKGEVLGFLGPNGAGKTTTMRILTGYLPATGGRAEVAGFDVTTQSLQARAHIGYMPESVPLYQEMSVGSYLQFMAGIKGIKNPRETIVRSMERANIGHRQKDQVGKLSKGLKQRVGLAQALLGEPAVLILDEPTSGLDPRQRTEVLGLVKSLAGEHTVILSSHVLSEVGATCSRVVIISDGRVQAEDTPENLERRLKGDDSIALTVRGPAPAVTKALKAVPKVLGVDAGEVNQYGYGTFLVHSQSGADVREAVAQAVVQGGWGLLEMRRSQMGLEEIFLKLTQSAEVKE
jgi:ABC-2 type transport system ATP-binding protein